MAGRGGVRQSPRPAVADGRTATALRWCAATATSRTIRERSIAAKRANLGHDEFRTPSIPPGDAPGATLRQRRESALARGACAARSAAQTGAERSADVRLADERRRPLVGSPGAPAGARAGRADHHARCARRPARVPRRRRVRPRHRRHAPEPRAGRLADVAPHARRLGLQPPRPDRPRQRGRPADGVDARPGHRRPGGDAAGVRRPALHAEPEGPPAGHRRGDRRPALGVPPRHPGGRPPHHGRADRQQPQRRHPRAADHRHRQRRLRLRARRGHRRAGLGDRDLRLPGPPGAPLRGADRRRRQGDLRPELPPAGGAGLVRHRRPRRGDGGRAVAGTARARAGRAGGRDLGRRPPTRSGCTSARGWSRATTPT